MTWYLCHKSSMDWIQDCLEAYGDVLRGKKAHWCPDWDFMPIDETCDEIEGCTCEFKQKYPIKATQMCSLFDAPWWIPASLFAVVSIGWIVFCWIAQ